MMPARGCGNARASVCPRELLRGSNQLPANAKVPETGTHSYCRDAAQTAAKLK